MEDFEDSRCQFLKNPVSLSSLIGDGTNFEINTNFEDNISQGFFEELGLDDDDDNDDDEEKKKVTTEHLFSPWLGTFSELREKMVKLNDHMYKNVLREGITDGGVVPKNARVCIRYNAYWEGEGTPFDSSILRGSIFTFYTGCDSVLEGLELAVRTMCSGEHAQFLISYQLLFREMGCPPRVKPRADGLFIIELVSFNVVGDFEADAQLSEEDRKKYPLVISTVKEIHKKALDFYSQGLYKNAIRAFEKCVQLLSACGLANDEEEAEQKTFLLKMYINLAVCYNKVNAPGKACVMCNEIRRLTQNNSPCKALFQEGRALLLLCEFERARKYLLAAQQLEPHNQEISKELKLLEERFSLYKANEKNIWSRAFGIIKETNKKCDDKKVADSFEEEMRNLMASLKEDLTISNFNLPPGLTQKEISTIDALAKDFDFKLTICPISKATRKLVRIKKK